MPPAKLFFIPLTLPIQLAFLAFLCLGCFFLNNHLETPSVMEALNFVTVREMIQEGNWLIPTMNDAIRLEKPPLPTWLSTLAVNFSGQVEHLGWLRLPAAIVASLMVFFMYGFTQTITPKKSLIPFFSAAVLATSFYIVYMGRQGTWDIFCHSFMLGGIWSLSYGLNLKKVSYLPFVMAGLLMGMSFMSKGPISFYVVLLPFAVAYLAAFGKQKVPNKKRPLVVAMLICLIVSSWWPAYLYATVPQDFIAIMTKEGSARFTNIVRPVWDYWDFPIHTGAWAFMVMVMLFYPYAKSRISQYSFPSNYKFIFLWVILTLVLLTLAPEKKDRYLMPALISMALGVGHLYDYLWQAYRDGKQTGGDKWVLGAQSTLIGLSALGIPMALYLLTRAEPIFKPGMLIAISLLFGTTGLGIFYALVKKKILNLFALSTLLMFFTSSILLPVFTKIKGRGADNLKSIRQLQIIEDLDFYFIADEMRAEQIWAIGRPVKPLDIGGDCSLKKKTPFALFTKELPEPDMLGACTDIEIQFVKSYDYQNSRFGGKWYVSVVDTRPTTGARLLGMDKKIGVVQTHINEDEW